MVYQAEWISPDWWQCLHRRPLIPRPLLNRKNKPRSAWVVW